jgi:hypothetical protein
MLGIQGFGGTLFLCHSSVFFLLLHFLERYVGTLLTVVPDRKKYGKQGI